MLYVLARLLSLWQLNHGTPFARGECKLGVRNFSTDEFNESCGDWQGDWEG